MTLRSILLSELNKRKERLSTEIDNKEKELLQYDDKKLSIAELDEQIKEYQSKFDKLQKKELDKYDYIIQLEDDTLEVVSKNDLEIVSDMDIIKKAHKYPMSITAMMKLTDTTRKEILEWVSKGRIPKNIYNELSNDNEPLPRGLYIDSKEGIGFAQLHIENIDKDTHDKFLLNELSIWEAIKDKPSHIDLRIKYNNSKNIVQFIIVDSNRIITKSEEYSPLTKDEAIELSELDLIEDSYWSESDGKYSYMMHIWSGDIVSGCERHDFHELFMTKTKCNQELFNGRYEIRCDKDKGYTYTKSSKPVDPILLSDIGYHKMAPANKVDGFNRHFYKEHSKKKYNSKLA